MLSVQNIQIYGVETFTINSIGYTHLSKDISNI